MNPRVLFIFITVFLDALGFGFVLPNLTGIIRRLESNPDHIATFFGLFVSLYSLMQFLASPILGALSDRFGRRPILLISLIGAALDYLLMAFANNLPLLYFGRIIAGLTGASYTVAASYVADISSDQDRTIHFGMIGAAYGLGFVMGPLFGGLLFQWGPTTPFLVAAVLNFCNFLYGLFILPETLPIEKRRKIILKNLNPFSSLTKILHFKDSLLILLAIFTLFHMASQIHPSNWTLYTHQRFGWSVKEFSYSLAILGLMIAVVQGLLTRIVIPHFGEFKLIQSGFFFACIALFFISIAGQSRQLFLCIFLYAFSGITLPAIQSLITKGVSNAEQGELQGTLVSLGSLSAVFSPLIYTEIFELFTNADSKIYFPGAAYFFASIIATIAWICWYSAKNKFQ